MGEREFRQLLYDRLAGLVAEQLAARADLARLRAEATATDTRIRAILDELRRQTA